MWVYGAVGAVIILAASGLPGLFTGRRGPGGAAGQRISVAMVVAGAALGMVAAFAVLMGGAGGSLQFRGPLANLTLHYGLDPLGAFFLVPILLVGVAGSVYGLGYWKQEEHPRTGQKLRLCYGLLIAALAMVVLAADAIAFLFAWEVMALSAFFLVSTEDDKVEVRETGWLYLVATHIGTLSLFAMFGLLRLACGSFDFLPVDAAHVSLGLRAAILLTALVGFGLKAGMMPLHFWLPSAHANAPSHVSALLSGVVLKIGIYGLLRTSLLVGAMPLGWGGGVLVLGTLSAVLGVLFALGQHDLKRLLAYHSVENIGIILMGLGLAMMGQASGRPEWVVLGMAGCLLHVWNHAMFKSLLFLAAGSVIHAVGTRDIDRMGGLAKAMPRTAMLFCLGAIAICGLPPLNGFVSELFVYLGLLRTLDASSSAAMAAPALALVGALALACFVKAFGAVFLGMPRASLRAHEAPGSMVGSMVLLAMGCLTIGLVPLLVARPLETVISYWSGSLREAVALDRLAPLYALTQLTLLLAAVLLLIGWWSGRSKQSVRVTGTWDCGYARPSSRMQYSASSFAQMLVGIFSGVLRPRRHEPMIRAPFPAEHRFHSHVDDVVLEGILIPVWREVRSRLAGLRVLQQGSVQSYVLYILIILSLLLLLTVPWSGTFVTLLGGGKP